MTTDDVPPEGNLDDGIEPEDPAEGDPSEELELSIVTVEDPDLAAAAPKARDIQEELSEPIPDPIFSPTLAVADREPAAPPALRDIDEERSEPIAVEEAPRVVSASESGTRKDDTSDRLIIAVASGRGGAGKSLLAANMAVYLAQIGKRVVAVDADPAGGALNHMLGTPRPARGFGSFLRGSAKTLEELAVDTPVAGVRLVAGEALPFGSPRPKAAARTVLEGLRALAADIVVVDLGPPDSPLCIDVWLGANTHVLVTLADPASIEATYRFVKSGFLRRLRGERGLDKLQAQAGRPLPSPLDLYRMALELGRSAREDETMAPVADGAGQARLPGIKIPAKVPALAATLATAMGTYRPRFVVSQTRSLGDTKLGQQMAMAAHRRLGHGLEYLGHVESDETVAAAGRRHRPVMAEFPEAKICKNIERIVRKLIASDGERSAVHAPPRLEEEQTLYEILGTEPGVSDEEIRRAYRLLKEIYVAGSPVISGLYEEAELAALHARAHIAHDTLFTPERRRLYDLSLPEADLARAVRRAAQAPRIDPAAAARNDFVPGASVVDADTEITGPVLRKVREARGLELSEVAQRTKIGERHLRSIEDERFDELPAAVYVRGFVSQFARILRIDPARAAENYLRRFHGATGPGSGTPLIKEV